MGKENYDRFLKSQNTLRDARRTSKQKRGKGGGGGFSDRWAPPKSDDGEEPEEIVLFKGEYKMPVKVGKKGAVKELERAYYLLFEHGRKTRNGWRSATCSAGMRLAVVDGEMELTYGDDPCPSCYHIDDGAGDINRRLMHVFNLITLGYWHLVDSDRTDDQGKPYKDWVPCEGRRCSMCKDGLKKHYGRRRFWEMGKRFIEQILTHAETILAKNCRCGGKLEVVGFECPNCGDVMVDLDDDPMDKKEINKFRAAPQRCPHCKKTDYPEAVTECDSCNDPTPLDIWDVKYQIMRTGTGTDTSLMISNWEILEEEEREKIQGLMKPYDFASGLFKRLEPAEQAKRLDIPNPFKDDDGRGGVDWKNRDKDDEEDDE